MSLNKSCIEDSNYDLIAYLEYWNCWYKHPRKIRDLARKYIKEKRLSTFEDACKCGNILLVKIHILSSCNVHIPNNFKAVMYESIQSPTKTESTPTKTESTPTKTESTPTKTESTPTKTESTPTKTESTPNKYVHILKILMHKKVNITNVFDLFSGMKEVPPVAIMVMKYIHDMKFDRHNSKADRYSECYRFAYHGPRSLLYYYCLTPYSAIREAIDTYIPRLKDNQSCWRISNYM
jgi:hypothetical protein